MFARGVAYPHTAHLPVQKSSASKSPVSITSKLIQTKGLQVLHSGHLRKTGGRGVAGHITFDRPHSSLACPEPAEWVACHFPPYNFLMNPSGLFKPRSAILSSVEAGPHPSCCRNDVPHRISGPLHSWPRLHDLCSLQADLWRQARHHRPPGCGPQGCARRATTPAFPRCFTRGRFPPAGAWPRPSRENSSRAVRTPPASPDRAAAGRTASSRTAPHRTTKGPRQIPPKHIAKHRRSGEDVANSSCPLPGQPSARAFPAHF